MNTSELLDKVFDLYKKTFWKQMVRVMALGAPVLILAAAFLFFGALSLYQGPVFVAVYIFILIITFLAWEALSISGNISLTKQAFYGKEASLGIMARDVRESFPRVFSVLSALFAMTAPLIAACAFAAFYIIGFLQSVSLNSFASAAFAGLAVFATALIITLFAAFYNTLVSSAVPAAVCENVFFMKAVVKSVNVIKGDYIKITGTFMIWRIISAVVNYSVLVLYYLATGSINNVIGWFTGYYTPGIFPSLIGVNLVSVWIFLIMSPFGGILSTAVYLNQRIKKEGLDIIIGLEMLRDGG